MQNALSSPRRKEKALGSQARPKVLFVNEWEAVSHPTIVARSNTPWPVLGQMEITPENLQAAVSQLPERLATLITALLQRGICRAVGVSNSELDGMTMGGLHFRPVQGQEDGIIPLLRELTGQTEQDDPARPEDFDLDDLMAELLTRQLYPPRPRA